MKILCIYYLFTLEKLLFIIFSDLNKESNLRGENLSDVSNKDLSRRDSLLNKENFMRNNLVSNRNDKEKNELEHRIQKTSDNLKKSNKINKNIQTSFINNKIEDQSAQYN